VSEHASGPVRGDGKRISLVKSLGIIGSAAAT
jgi:hypothetical protein